MSTKQTREEIKAILAKWDAEFPRPPKPENHVDCKNCGQEVSSTYVNKKGNCERCQERLRQIALDKLKYELS